MRSCAAAVLLLACFDTAWAQPMRDGTAPAKKHDVPSHAAKPDYLLLAAKQALEDTSALAKDLNKAFATNDIVWYSDALRFRPKEIKDAFAHTAKQAEGTPSYGQRFAIFSSCWIAADRLSYVAKYVMERPSQHYRDEFAALYEHDIEDCKKAIDTNAGPAAYQLGE